MEKIELTRAEIDTLNQYAEKVRRETIEAIFADFTELLQARYKLEDQRRRHLYGTELCEILLIDLQKIERKYMEE